MTADIAGQHKITGWHVAAAFATFFGVIIIVNVTMAVIASRSWSGLVVQNSYVASQEFNEKQAAARRQAERGWSTSISHSRGQMVLRISEGNGNPVHLDHLAASVGRPATEAMDRTVALSERSPGEYAGDLAAEPGVWLVRLSGYRGNDAYRLETRIVVDAAAGSNTP